MQFRFNLLSFVSLAGVALSLPISHNRREVPQEHSHEKFLTSVRTSLNLNNPDGIQDPVFGLLGNAAAAAGAGKITDLDCLQQATADQAFTNAKQAGDVDGQVAALIYRALERNTGKVGLASVACTSIQAVNPEIAAIQQHQDPASDNAASINKQIVLNLAQQIAAVGGDPTLALESGTFAPGNVNDPTAAGNTCDDPNDAEGCIFTENKLVPDATDAEIQAAVASGSSAGNSANAGSDAGASDTSGAGAGNSTISGNSSSGSDSSSSGSSSSGSSSSGSSTNSGSSNSTSTGDNSSDNSSTAGAASSTAGQNVQTFTGALGGAAAPPVVVGGKGFIVDNSEFLNIGAALGRSCDVQHNQCANIANSAAGRSAGLTVGQCDQQDTACKAAGANAQN
ncbi:hypothetical protein NP233_g2574 [Leucocoprinus birnbaumii]|uniref:Uncharacterized protein n=1 Tax=Leucocoprinus birnbaumii TaxID=56174 RepID=A0AAD5VYP8_9AGAR|nr:hypothetical protein NP233_g2574 [Leucocoprinus birnbaumii]